MSEQTYAKRKLQTTQKGTKTPAAPMQQSVPNSAFLTDGASRIDLPEAMRQKMENAYGTDLSAVKVYQSQKVADGGAEAVTMGNTIAFAPGKFDMTSQSGQALLGHEVSHVVSQSRGEVQGHGVVDNASLEARADREGAMAAAGEQVYNGPVTAPLSSASPAGMAGPMQCKKKSKPKMTEAETDKWNSEFDRIHENMVEKRNELGKRKSAQNENTLQNLDTSNKLLSTLGTENSKQLRAMMIKQRVASARDLLAAKRTSKKQFKNKDEARLRAYHSQERVNFQAYEDMHNQTLSGMTAEQQAQYNKELKNLSRSDRKALQKAQGMLSAPQGGSVSEEEQKQIEMDNTALTEQRAMRNRNDRRAEYERYEADDNEAVDELYQNPYVDEWEDDREREQMNRSDVMSEDFDEVEDDFDRHIS